VFAKLIDKKLSRSISSRIYAGPSVAIPCDHLKDKRIHRDLGWFSLIVLGTDPMHAVKIATLSIDRSRKHQANCSNVVLVKPMTTKQTRAVTRRVIARLILSGIIEPTIKLILHRLSSMDPVPQTGQREPTSISFLRPRFEQK
jgi:hypothetical protein